MRARGARAVSLAQASAEVTIFVTALTIYAIAAGDPGFAEERAQE